MVIVDIIAPEMIAGPHRHRDFICSIFCSGLAETPRDSRAREASRLADRSCGAASLVWRLTFACASLSGYRRSAVPSSLRFALSLSASRPLSLALALAAVLVVFHRNYLSRPTHPQLSAYSISCHLARYQTRSRAISRDLARSQRAISANVLTDLAPSRAISANVLTVRSASGASDD
jgi:hypothetical protein